MDLKINDLIDDVEIQTYNFIGFKSRTTEVWFSDRMLLLRFIRHALKPQNLDFLFLRSLHRKSRKSMPKVSPSLPPPPPPPPFPSSPTPPKPPQKPISVTMHGLTWQDPYSWMTDVEDQVSMRHMEVHLDKEDEYTAEVMASSLRLQDKLQSEMSVRMASDLCSPPVKWGPWLYYRRMEDGKEYPILCRRSARLHEEFVTHSTPDGGFDFDSGKRIEQKLLDYNRESERFGGVKISFFLDYRFLRNAYYNNSCVFFDVFLGQVYEELSQVSPDHRYLAYTMHDKDKDVFTLCVRDLTTGTLCGHPRADGVAHLSWTIDGKALLYTVKDKDERPYR